MIETLYIQNFQSHEKTKIDFDSYVTTIVGSYLWNLKFGNQL